jgi:hypothetical protein
VHREQHAGGVYLAHDAKQVGGAPCVAGAVYYLVPVHTKLVKAVVVYPLVVQNHFLVVRLACRVNAESEPARGLMSSIRLAKLK